MPGVVHTPFAFRMNKIFDETKKTLVHSRVERRIVRVNLNFSFYPSLHPAYLFLLLQSEKPGAPSQGVGLGRGGPISAGMGGAGMAGMMGGGGRGRRPGVKMMKGRGGA